MSERANTEADAREARRRRRKRYGASMKLTRRLHMYFGLVLTPFVLLYGVTAILFNHPTLLSDRSKESVDAGLFADVEFPDAEALASAIVEAMNADGETAFRLDPDVGVEFTSDFIVDANTEEQRARYRLYAPSLNGSVTRTPLDPESEADAGGELPFPDSVVVPTTEAIDAITEALKAETGAERVQVRRAPSVEFGVVVDGETWLVSCDLRGGGIEARRPGEPTREIEARSFLTRLHLSRGYPDTFTARTVWAVAVDVTAGLMIFWAVSGVAMWWQMRPTRKAGALAGIAGLLGAGILGYAMFLIFYY